MLAAKNTEDVYDISFTFDFNTFDKSSNVGFEFYKQNAFGKFFSYTPFVQLNINSFSMAGSEIKDNLYAFNHWADKAVTNTVLLNVLLLGTPYVVMGFFDVASCPYILTYGITADVHPYINDYVDTRVSIGIKNDPYQVLKYNETKEWIRPFGIFRIEAIGRYKILKASFSVSYNYDLSCKIKEEDDLSYWNLGLTLGVNLGRKSKPSRLDRYFPETSNTSVDSDSSVNNPKKSGGTEDREYSSGNDEYVADFTI